MGYIAKPEAATKMPGSFWFKFKGLGERRLGEWGAYLRTGRLSANLPGPVLCNLKCTTNDSAALRAHHGRRLLLVDCLNFISTQLTMIRDQ